MHHRDRSWRWMLAAIWMLASPLASAQDMIVILDENDIAGADFREASSGDVTAPDFLRLANGNRLPIESDHAHAGQTSGLLEYRHTDGSWTMTVSREGSSAFDITGFDSLVVFVNGPTFVTGTEIPRLRLEDEEGSMTAPVWLSSLRNVQIDGEASGFTSESETNAVLLADYIEELPSRARRPGYPGGLTITFSDEAIDTSVAAIGAPSVPANFRIVTENGYFANFRFRDLDEDGTLSRTDEYVDVLLPRDEDADGEVGTWRFTLAPTQGPEPLDAPGEGDVYQLSMTFDEFTLDADDGTWQRVSVALDELLADGAIDPTAVQSVVFMHGGENEAPRTLWFDSLYVAKNDDEAFLDMVQRATFDYFWFEANPNNGLIKDRSTPTSPSSIAAVGFGLSAITVGIDRGWITAEEGRQRILTTLEFFWNAPQSTAPDATGYKGFFYHFLDMNTGRRVWNSELSTIDTALLLGGVLHVREYFLEDDEIRSLADSIYHRVDWRWVQNHPPAISHGWRPESGFITHDWLGYNEAMILYILAIGSPTYHVDPKAWDAWVSGYGGQWRTEYGYTFLTFPPLFGHQYSHVWIDFRGIQDDYMRDRSIDYFENSRRATLAQRAYHIANPQEWPNYSKDEWGLTASDTPTGYRARGAPPPQNDDGTLVPTAPGGSIVFTPEESIAALRTMYERYEHRLWGPYGFRDAYNVSEDWFDEDYLGIDQGPILLMIENLRTEGIWKVSMRHDAIKQGLVKAGFAGEGLSTSGGEWPEMPLRLSIYPNPTSEKVQIEYSIPQPGPVRLTLYDVLGREMMTVDEAFTTTGRHDVILAIDELASGLYILVLESGGKQASRLMTKLR